MRAAISSCRNARNATREATAYRMMARGGIWTTDEVKTMASFLGREFGPDVPRAKPQQR
jgi:hypothetical protein